VVTNFHIKITYLFMNFVIFKFKFDFYTLLTIRKSFFFYFFLCDFKDKIIHMIQIALYKGEFSLFLIPCAEIRKKT